MNTNEYISDAVIRRLPRYCRYLEELMDNGFTRISSDELSKRMGLTASQVRQDFNHFGGFGQQGYGYNVKTLHSEVAHILGIDHVHTVIIVGAGHLGQALANYPNFEKRKFHILALFDTNPSVIGTTESGLPVYPVSQLESFIKENNVDIGVLTIPKSEAVKMGTKLAECGIKGIWNFASTDLEIPGSDVIIENAHLSDSIMRLSYQLNNAEKA